LTAHGSAAAVAVGPATTGGARDGAAVDGTAEVTTVGSGVFDTVESLAPHPATVSVAAAIRTAHFTSPDRTGTVTGRQTGARQGNASATTRLHPK
jgi:hypothetical protein